MSRVILINVVNDMIYFPTPFPLTFTLTLLSVVHVITTLLE